MAHLLRLALAGLSGIVLAMPAIAQEADGATLFSRHCASCHIVQAPDGTLIAGRAARTGPNLYGVAGRPAATVPDFPYGEAILAWAAAGGVWDEASFAAYVQDPVGFLGATLGAEQVRSRMAFQLRDPAEVAAIWAFLSQAAQ